MGVRVKVPPVRVRAAESKTGRRGAWSGGLEKRPAAIGGSCPPVARVLIGRPRKAGATTTGSMGSAEGRAGAASMSRAFAMMGTLSGSDVSITEGGPRRERFSWTLSEATDELGGLGIALSGIKKRIRTGTCTMSDGRERSLNRWMMWRCKEGFCREMTELRLCAWYMPKPGSISVGCKSSDSQVVSSGCCWTESQIRS